MIKEQGPCQKAEETTLQSAEQEKRETQTAALSAASDLQLGHKGKRGKG